MAGSVINVATIKQTAWSAQGPNVLSAADQIKGVPQPLSMRLSELLRTHRTKTFDQLTVEKGKCCRPVEHLRGSGRGLLVLTWVVHGAEGLVCYGVPLHCVTSARVAGRNRKVD